MSFEMDSYELINLSKIPESYIGEYGNVLGYHLDVEKVNPWELKALNRWLNDYIETYHPDIVTDKKQ